eukprot:1482161-Rhodomonas_salina.3
MVFGLAVCPNLARCEVIPSTFLRWRSWRWLTCFSYNESQLCCLFFFSSCTSLLTRPRIRPCPRDACHSVVSVAVASISLGQTDIKTREFSSPSGRSLYILPSCSCPIQENRNSTAVKAAARRLLSFFVPSAVYKSRLSSSHHSSLLQPQSSRCAINRCFPHTIFMSLPGYGVICQYAVRDANVSVWTEYVTSGPNTQLQHVEGVT